MFSGELAVRVNEQEYRVGEGEAIRFRADRAHAYHNPGEGLAKISLVIHYTG